MGMTAADYSEQLRALMPPGEAWNTEPGSEQGAILAGISQEFARIDARGADLIKEMHPATAVELLPEWEALYEIPVIAGATLQQRQTIAAWYHSHGGDIKQPHYVELAAIFGYTITISDYLEAQADWLCADDYLWEEPFIAASAGISLAGDYMAQADIILPWIWEITVEAIPATVPSPTLEQIMADFKPAHIQINYNYPEV